MYFVFQNDILPKELRDFAYNQVFDMPRAAQVTRLTRRCAVTGRLRGNFHQFRVSRFIFRQEGTLHYPVTQVSLSLKILSFVPADANRISGAIRANWMKNIDIKP